MFSGQENNTTPVKSNQSSRQLAFAGSSPQKSHIPIAVTSPRPLRTPVKVYRRQCNNTVPNHNTCLLCELSVNSKDVVKLFKKAKTPIAAELENSLGVQLPCLPDEQSPVVCKGCRKKVGDINKFMLLRKKYAEICSNVVAEKCSQKRMTPPTWLSPPNSTQQSQVSKGKKRILLDSYVDKENLGCLPLCDDLGVPCSLTLTPETPTTHNIVPVRCGKQNLISTRKVVKAQETQTECSGGQFQCREGEVWVGVDFIFPDMTFIKQYKIVYHVCSEYIVH